MKADPAGFQMTIKKREIEFNLASFSIPVEYDLISEKP